ncbi:E3 ubiquitin-protein ligase RLIM [Rhodamnia argentea]|uniref:E3 ubiquitin-protein ligase RLIM n=1 Tax=Rhodamnia argentea TaxID=178133 RepID=A0A8B8PHS6_9MYRT|nr:E3 ubiquitin-protein ligase RLIM [Rhodamnia argentea]XP_030534006.1 E3 ubiquitin-protein ligase RLIM [Rhodamnia argentea]XP_048136826.1 E3 ubiquitin-protein ligase RLIM [Rhodamnia argentea]XP_048136836.1 E3 ubiquitin-protein ligase RLIM [Rhodamnia argentea]
MEDVNVDVHQAAEVPDTPDRLIARCSKNGIETKVNSLAPGSSRCSGSLDQESPNWLGKGGRAVNGMGRQNPRLQICPPKRILNAVEFGRRRGDPVGDLSLDNSNASQHHLFRRAAGNGHVKPDSRHSSGADNMERGKAASIGVPMSFASSEKGAALNAIQRNGHNGFVKTSEPFGNSEGFLADDFRRFEIKTDNEHSYPCSESFQTLNRFGKGKEKLDESACKYASSVKFGEKAIDVREKSSKHVSQSPISVSSPRHIGKKRLVRNGCISPLNIATREKEIAEKKSGNAEDSIPDRNKGKGILMHPCTSEKPEGKLSDILTRRPIIHGEDKGTNDATVNLNQGCESLGGWRTTHVHAKKARHGSEADVLLSGGTDSAGNLFHNRDNIVGKRTSSYRHQSSSSGSIANMNTHQRISEIVSEGGQTRGRPIPTRTSTRRQNSREICFGDGNSYNSEVICLSSPGDSRNRSSARQRRQHQGASSSVIEIDDASPGMSQSGTTILDTLNSFESDSRARQLEADEILARELQEQLYNDSPMLGTGEMDEYLARLLQQEENVGGNASASVRSRRRTGHGNSSQTHSRRQPLPRSFRNLSNRRGTEARVPVHARLQRSRRPISRSPSSFLSGERTLHFPLNMDLDMRMDILEALEAALGDVSDIGLSSTNFQTQRDFNENDYEMLLALDENNHNVGTSDNHINSLPESKVQTNVYEEACAICLDTPTIGDAIRHLPCLHKFHKDCIDPWLRRSTSCPVCKSSIT